MLRGCTLVTRLYQPDCINRLYWPGVHWSNCLNWSIFNPSYLHRHGLWGWHLADRRYVNIAKCFLPFLFIPLWTICTGQPLLYCKGCMGGLWNYILCGIASCMGLRYAWDCIVHGIALCLGSHCAWDHIVRIKLFRLWSHRTNCIVAWDCIMQIAIQDCILWIAVRLLPRGIEPCRLIHDIALWGLYHEVASCGLYRGIARLLRMHPFQPFS